MNENLVMEEDTIYEIDPICMKQKQKNKVKIEEKGNDKLKEAREIKGEEHMATNFDFKFLIIVIIFLRFK